MSDVKIQVLEERLVIKVAERGVVRVQESGARGATGPQGPVGPGYEPTYPITMIKPYIYLLEGALYEYDPVGLSWSRLIGDIGQAVKVRIMTKQHADDDISKNKVYLDGQGLPMEIMKYVRRKAPYKNVNPNSGVDYPDRQGTRFMPFNMLANGQVIFDFTKWVPPSVVKYHHWKFCNWARDVNNNIVRFNQSETITTVGHKDGKDYSLDCSTLQLRQAI